MLCFVAIIPLVSSIIALRSTKSGERGTAAEGERSGKAQNLSAAASL